MILYFKDFIDHAVVGEAIENKHALAKVFPNHRLDNTRINITRIATIRCPISPVE